jgi:hypothetical protein
VFLQEACRNGAESLFTADNLIIKIDFALFLIADIIVLPGSR